SHRRRIYLLRNRSAELALLNTRQFKLILTPHPSSRSCRPCVASNEVCNPSRVPAAKPFSDAFTACKPRTSASADSTRRPARPLVLCARQTPSGSTFGYRFLEWATEGRRWPRRKTTPGV